MTEGQTVYTIEPWVPYSRDSGQINGLSGRGGYHGAPIKGDDDNWLMFGTFKEAETEAARRGYDRGDVCERRWFILDPTTAVSDWTAHPPK